MPVGSLARRHPLSTLAAASFVVALAITTAYWAGTIPGIPKTLPTFVDLVTVTAALFGLTALAWAISLRER